MTPIFEILLIVGLIALLAYLIARRRKQLAIELSTLSENDASRYRTMMDDAVQKLDVNPQQAAAQARGIVEEVMRRRGLRDRIDSAQRVRDLRSINRDAAGAFEAGNIQLAAGGPSLTRRCSATARRWTRSSTLLSPSYSDTLADLRQRE